MNECKALLNAFLMDNSFPSHLKSEIFLMKFERVIDETKLINSNDQRLLITKLYQCINKQAKIRLEEKMQLLLHFKYNDIYDMISKTNITQTKTTNLSFKQQ